MRIGIIGTGNVGSTLGRRWAQHGHEVLFGSRDPGSEKLRALLAASGAHARAGSYAEAAAFGETVVIALPYAVLHETLPDLGDLRGKVVLDAVNHMGAPADAPTVAAQIAALLPGARVVKAFSTMGWNVMADTHFGDLRADQFICGDDAEAKTIAADLSRDLGFEVVDAGPLANAGLLEALALLWIDLALRRGMGRETAFKLLRRQ